LGAKRSPHLWRTSSTSSDECREYSGEEKTKLKESTGVSWDKKARKWKVQMQVQGVQKYLGSFDDEESAARKLNIDDYELPKTATAPPATARTPPRLAPIPWPEAMRTPPLPVHVPPLALTSPHRAMSTSEEEQEQERDHCEHAVTPALVVAASGGGGVDEEDPQPELEPQPDLGQSRAFVYPDVQQYIPVFPRQQLIPPFPGQYRCFHIPDHVPVFPRHAPLTVRRGISDVQPAHLASESPAQHGG
jgi:hypothetical protein